MNNITYTMVVAMDENRGIGIDNKMPWHFPEELQNFKCITTGHPILMGRKTYESIGRPLPNRQNIVLTRDKNWHAEGISVIHSLEDLLCLTLIHPEIMVIGGGEVFALLLPSITRVRLSKINGKYLTDTWLQEFESAFHPPHSQTEFENFTSLCYEKK